jgi:hypothetical protein
VPRRRERVAQVLPADVIPRRPDPTRPRPTRARAHPRVWRRGPSGVRARARERGRVGRACAVNRFGGGSDAHAPPPPPRPRRAIVVSHLVASRFASSRRIASHRVSSRRLSVRLASSCREGRRDAREVSDEDARRLRPCVGLEDDRAPGELGAVERRDRVARDGGRLELRQCAVRGRRSATMGGGGLGRSATSPGGRGQSSVNRPQKEDEARRPERSARVTPLPRARSAAATSTRAVVAAASPPVRCSREPKAVRRSSQEKRGRP